MKKISKYSIAVLLSLMIALQGCELESEIYSDINPAIYPTTVRDAEDLVTGNCYGAFRNNGYDGLFNAATGVQLNTDMASDYGHCSWDDGGSWRRLMTASYSPIGDERNVTNIWRDYYNYISKMTLTIDRIENMDINESSKKQLIAELRCGRGFLAFILYDLYGPIIVADLETLKSPLADKILPRLSDEDSRKFIVDELTAAANVAELPYSYKKGDPGYGRFTKGLCHMVLLKFYMQTKQWDKAEIEGRELMKSEYGYNLVTTSYKDVFAGDKEKNIETIWSVNCLEGTMTHKWFPHVLTNNYPGYNGGWGGYKMTWDFFKTFEDGDQRKETIIYEYTFMGKGSKDQDSLITYNEQTKGTGGNSLAEGVLPVKYDFLTNVIGENSQTDWIVYRYADAITLLAEAIVRKNNAVSTEAIGLLNRVRTRAGLTAYVASDFANVGDFLNKLLMERGHELYFEGCRRQDLIRHGVYVQKMKEKCAAKGWQTLVNENRILFPLEEKFIVEGQGIVKQNPGY
jgi:hypothetical protein